jgi:hypothetical protein
MLKTYTNNDKIIVTNLVESINLADISKGIVCKLVTRLLKENILLKNNDYSESYTRGTYYKINYESLIMYKKIHF